LDNSNIEIFGQNASLFPEMTEKKKMTQKGNTPKRKRFTKQQRLNTATNWITGDEGKTLYQDMQNGLELTNLCD